MAVNTVDLGDAPAWVVTTGEGMRAATIRGLHSAALRGVQEIVSRIIPSRSPMPVDRAIYRAGWRAVIRSDGADIENLEPHAVFIEEGVRGENVKIGKAMIDALMEWVVRKRITTPEDAKGAAFAIAKSMQARGIFNGGTGFGILRELVDVHLARFIDEECAREIAKVG